MSGWGYNGGCICLCQRHNTFYSGLHGRRWSVTTQIIYRYSNLFYQRSWLTTEISRGDEQKASEGSWMVTFKPIRSLFNNMTDTVGMWRNRASFKTESSLKWSNNCIWRCSMGLMQDPYMQQWMRSSKNPISMLQLFTREKSDKQPELGLKPKQGIQVYNAWHPKQMPFLHKVHI